MNKILGLDLGTNSIGWAIVDNSSNELINCGVSIIPSSFSLARQKRKSENFVSTSIDILREKCLVRQANPIILTLFFCSFLTALLTFVNYSNWQFWLNLFLTTLIATLSLLHSNNKK